MTMKQIIDELELLGYRVVPVKYGFRIGTDAVTMAHVVGGVAEMRRALEFFRERGRA